MAIVRIVKMTFRKEDTGHFKKLFEERSDSIRAFPGCENLELLQHNKDENILFTYSIWRSEHDLDHYRFSKFFRETWSITKTYFAGKPEAWTLLSISKG